MTRDEPLPPEDVSNMYILSNTAGMLRSAALFYPDTREHMGSGVLPGRIRKWTSE